MRQLIIAAATLIALTAVSSTLALRAQSQPAVHCGAFLASSPCPGGRISALPLDL
jgi:hypothetical protein